MASAFTTALNTQTGNLQSVPANWVNNPNRFGGAFVTPPNITGPDTHNAQDEAAAVVPPTPAKPTSKRSRS